MVVRGKIMADKEGAWETRVARKTRTRTSNSRCRNRNEKHNGSRTIRPGQAIPRSVASHTREMT
jgi:hypothetical protein